MPGIVSQIAKWAGPSVLLWLAGKAIQPVADTAEAGKEAVDSVTKAAPWIVGGLALYLVMKGKR